MTKLALCACAAALAGLAACTTYYDPPPAAPVATTTGVPVVTASPAAAAARTGIIESISLAASAGSASAGGTAPTSAGPYRFALRMDDGTSQTLVLDNRAFLVGDRVQVLADGRLARL